MYVIAQRREKKKSAIRGSKRRSQVGVQAGVSKGRKGKGYVRPGP